jgi:2-dehydro-3-deoxyphosphooctonate aldolase (KDO 8-P synthase)
MAGAIKGGARHPRRIEIGDLEAGQDLPFVLIAGPCQIESRDHALEMAEALSDICGEREIGLIYKSSFDKANRTSGASARGVGLAKGVDILADVKERFGCPTITDVHESDQCAPVAEAVDVLQIPAFLCRQTDLLKAAAETGAAVHVKKGQFLAPWDMAHVVAKLEYFGADRILLGERGTSFGYNTLVSDFRGLPTMAATGWPVVFDATHSVQQPGGQGGSSGGQREFVPVLARAAIAVGVACLFIETHQDPDSAPSDGPNMVPVNQLSRLLSVLQEFDRLAKSHPLHPTLS